MQRRLFFVFGVLSHGLFLVVFAYMAGFVGNFLVPKSIDSPAAAAGGGLTAARVALDLLLLALFTVPHSVMARPAFKRWWTQFVPAPVERSVYVFISCVLMARCCSSGSRSVRSFMTFRIRSRASPPGCCSLLAGCSCRSPV